MCEYCKNIIEIKSENEYKKHPIDADTDEFPEREKLILAKLSGKIIFYGFNKYCYEDDAMYELEVNYCPKCGRNLTEE